MDIIAFNEASTANGRIESFIENPDSASGIVTVPKVIASGETVMIPAGRVAVLPNVQIDGTLNIDGEVFIPSGSTMSQVVPRVTSTDNAIVRFDGTTGAVQNSGVIIDDSNNVGIGTTPYIVGNFRTMQLDGVGGSLLSLKYNGTLVSNCYADNTGLNLTTQNATPVIIQTNDTERMRITNSGNLLVGTTTDNGVDKLQVNGIASASRFRSNRLTISTVASTWVNISTLGSGLHIITQSEYNASVYGACMIVLVAEGSAFIVSNTGPAIILRMSGVTAQINFPFTMLAGVSITTLN